MDTYIDTRFERLEKALASLIDSVNKYHPSTIHARELEAADEELIKGLEQSMPPFPSSSSVSPYSQVP